MDSAEAAAENSRPGGKTLLHILGPGWRSPHTHDSIPLIRASRAALGRLGSDSAGASELGPAGPARAGRGPV